MKVAELIKNTRAMLKALHKTLQLYKLIHTPIISTTNSKRRAEALYIKSINLKHRITLEMIITEAEIIMGNAGDHG